MSLTVEEQETHINFSRGDERAKIYTSDTTTMTKLNKLVELQGTEWKLEGVTKLKSVLFLLFRSVKSEYKGICQKNNGRKSRLDSVIQQACVILETKRV